MSNENYLFLPGEAAADRAYSVNNAALNITADLDLRIRLAPTSWGGPTEQLINKRAGTSSNISYHWRIGAGTMLFLWSEDGSTAKNRSATVSLNGTATDGRATWLRVTADVDNGASDADIKFWWSEDDTNDPDTVTWTQLGATVAVGATTSIYNGAAVLEVGSYAGGSFELDAQVYRACVYDGIDGTRVWDVDLTALTEDEIVAASFTDGASSLPVLLSGNSWAYVRPTAALIASRAELVLQANDGNGGGSPKWADRSGNDHHAQLGSAAGADTNDPLFLEPTEKNEQFLYLPGTAGNGASRPTGLVAWTTSFSLKARVRFDTDPLGAADDASVFASWVPAGDESMIFRIDNVSGEMDTFLASVSKGQSSGLDITAGEDIWLRVDGVVGGGDGTLTYYSSTTDTNDPDSVVWGAALNQHTGLTIVPNTFNEITQVGPWGASSNNDLWDGRVYRVQLTGDGSVVFDADFTDRQVVTEPYATFTEKSSNAATVTINRSATGVPATVVDQAMFVFDGVDDYMVIADHANLEFAQGEDMTLMAVARTHAVNNTYALASKQLSVTSNGYGVYQSSSGTKLLGRFNDSALTVVNANGPGNMAANTLAVGAIVRNTTDDDVTVFEDGVTGTPTTDATTLISGASGNMRIGQSNGGSYPLWGQVIAVALWREALTDEEIIEASQEIAGEATTGVVALYYSHY